MERLQRIMIAHGMLVVFSGVLAGFMLMSRLVGGWEVWPGHIVNFSVFGSTEGWVRAHTGCVANGLLVLAAAFALPKFNVTPGRMKFMVYGYIYAAWSFVWFYWVGNAAANHGLTFGASPLGEASLIGVIAAIPGVPSLILSPVLLVMTAMAVWPKKA